MAGIENRLNSALVLKYQVGTNPDGSPDIRQKTIANVKPRNLKLIIESPVELYVFASG